MVALVIGTGPLINSSITERPNSGIRIESSFLASAAATGFVFLASFNFLRDIPALSHIAIVDGLSKYLSNLAPLPPACAVTTSTAYLFKSYNLLYFPTKRNGSVRKRNMASPTPDTAL